MSKELAGSAAPDAVAQTTANGTDPAGDAADQADRLTMIMEAEAARNALRDSLDGTGGYRDGMDGEGSDDGLSYPLDDVEDLIAAEGADDSSDDPLHAGGFSPDPLRTPEQAAMRVVDGLDGEGSYIEESDHDRADPLRDPYETPARDLTPEDETLLGVDPYDEADETNENYDEGAI